MSKHRSAPPRSIAVSVLCAGLVAATLFVTTAAHAGRASSWEDKVDPAVLAAVRNGGAVSFLVVLRSTPSSRHASGTPSQLVRSLEGIAHRTQAPILAQLQAMGASFLPFWIVDAVAVQGGLPLVRVLASRADVAGIGSDEPFHLEGAPATGPSPDDPGIPWNIEKVGAPQVWAKGDTGRGIVVGSSDTGIEWTHEALKSQYRGWDGGEAHHDYNWWDAIHTDVNGNPNNPCGVNSPEPCDDDGHGTGTLGVADGNGGPDHRIGVAPDARWIACRSMDQGTGRPTTYIDCLQFFLAPTDRSGQDPDPSKRPDIVNNSYDCPEEEGCTGVTLEAFRQAVANLRSAGVFFSAVTANDAKPSDVCSTVHTAPGIYDEATTVGATDSNDRIVSFSGRGPVMVDGSGRLKPDLTAPGLVIVTSARRNGYTSGSGTSYSAPHVSGAVALLWSAFPFLRRDVDRTESILEQSAVHLTTNEGCGGDTPDQVPNNTFGYGRLDVLAAYELADSQATHRPDALIKLGKERSYVGDGVYDDGGAGQVKKKAVARGSTIAFDVLVQNDGDAMASLVVDGMPSRPGCEAHYFAGGEDVTAQVVRGTYTLVGVPAGGSRRVRLRVRVGRSAAPGLRPPWLIQVLDRTGGRDLRDAVKATVRVVRSVR